MRTERLTFAVEAPRIDEVSALYSQPDGPTRERAVLLANGAGFHMESPWMAALAEGLVERGYRVLRFHYPYKERSVREGRTLPPNKAPVLEDCHERALGELLRRTDGARPLLAGKSLGARMSTHLAAKDVACAGLVLFGYPLHPAGKPEKLRSEHFAAIVQPSLFFQGTRDALCDLTLFERERARLGGPVTVEVVEDADHGFHVRKSSGTTDEEVLRRMLDATVAWEDAILPTG